MVVGTYRALISQSICDEKCSLSNLDYSGGRRRKFGGCLKGWGYFEQLSCHRKGGRN